MSCANVVQIINKKPQLTEYQLRFNCNRGNYWIRTSDPLGVNQVL